MRKQIFFLLSSVVVCMSIAGMEKEEQEKGLVALPKDMICKTTQYCDLQSIGRFKQVCEQFSKYDTAQLMCLMPIDNKCFSVSYSQLTKDYNRCSHILTHCISDENLFDLLYSLHKNERDEELKNIYATMPQFLTIRDRILGYSGRYSDGDLIQACIDIEEKYQSGLSKEVLVEKAKKNQLKLFFKGACEKGNAALVKLFIEQGVNSNAFDPWDGYALTQYAFDQRNFILLHKFYEYPHKRKSPFYYACKDNKFDLAKLLIKNGAKVDSSILYSMCNEGNIEASKFLIENGANIYVVNIVGTSALDIMSSKPEFKELVDSFPFLDKNPRLIRNTTTLLLAFGVGGLGYYLYNKISQG